ncbi:MAG: FxDxF family PEP-CTERM protein [Pseudomonadota bacterium]
MKLKHMLCALACIGATTVSVQSSAASYGFTNVGDITGALTTGDMEFYAAGLQAVIPGSFIQDFFFQSGITYYGVGVVADLPSAGSSYNINGLSVSLFSDGGMVGVADAGDAELINFGTGDNVFGDAVVGAGSYYFRISGDAVGTKGGIFSYSASAAPVPEAETWAMMAMGLGLVGLQLRRRKAGERIA